MNNQFIGVIESIDDPEKLGRVKVRCYGYHNDSKAELPSQDLPWATICMPVTSASISGVSETPELLPGSRVYGVFLDSLNQSPLVIGTILCSVNKKDPSKGFSDPSGYYPIELNTSPLPKKALSSYPYNKVKQTSSGHILEFDDTPGNERIHILHRTGSRIELLSNGDVIMAFNDKSELNKNSNIKISGNSNISIDGNSNITVNGSASQKVSGDYSIYANRIYLNSSFGGNNDSFIDNKAFLTPNIIEVGILEEALREVPNLPVNKEQKDDGASGTICAYENSQNPYEFARELMKLKWEEDGDTSNIRQIWEEINIFDPEKAVREKIAWCAVFVSAILKRTGNEYIRTAFARNYLKYGSSVAGVTIEEKVSNATAGDILVFSRGGESGHVSFYTGEYSPETGKVAGLGGNQGNTLKVSYFPINNPRMKLLDIRRPKGCANTDKKKIESVKCEIPTKLNKSDDLQSLALNIFHEAKGEPDEGKIAVAFVTLNRARNSNNFWPRTISKVVYETTLRGEGQFSWTQDNISDIPKEEEKLIWCQCLEIARKVLNSEIENPISTCTYYHASRINPNEFKSYASIHELSFYKQIGKHLFYKFKKEEYN